MKHNFDHIIDELQTNGKIVLGKESQATLYRWVHKINLELKRRGLNWRVMPLYKEKVIQIKNMTQFLESKERK